MTTGNRETSVGEYDGVEIVKRYKRLRGVCTQCNDSLVKSVSGNCLRDGAKRLGLLRDGIIAFGNESESCILMDYCLYDMVHLGKNVIGRFLEKYPPDLSSEAGECWAAMQSALYTALIVKKVIPEVGVVVVDARTNAMRLLVDMGLSRSIGVGYSLATRLIDFGDFVITTGAALPMGQFTVDQIDNWLTQAHALLNTEGFDPATFIRPILEQGSSANVRYEEGHLDRPHRPRTQTIRSSSTRGSAHAYSTTRPLSTLDPNRRCRCKSGKMYKNCCGKVQATS